MRQVVVIADTLAWLQASGTFCAVAAALGIAWRGERRERQRRPVLSLAFDPSLEPPDFMRGMWSRHGEDQWESHWVRLRVENSAGRRSADDVEVLFLSLEALDEAGSQRTLDVVPLRWSSTQGDAGGALTRITIPPGLARHVDLLAIRGRCPEADPEAHQPPVAIQVWPVPTDERHRLRGGRYVFHLAVAARDTDAAFFRVDVTVPGERFPADEIRDHLSVSQPVLVRQSGHRRR
jgi:hypothetical protein